MSRKFGACFDNLKFEKKGPGSRFMKEFEGHKRDFGSSADLDQVYEMNLVIPGVPYSVYYDDDESVVKLSGHDMLAFPKLVIAKIIHLLDKQIQLANAAGVSNSCNRVILVGGFGDSPYLNTTVRDWCNERGRGKLRLLCPEHPQAAIVRGAALRGLENTAPIRKRCRRHYGYVTWTTFREGVDPPSRLIHDEWSGEKLCEGRMVWPIQKGQVIDEDTCLPQLYSSSLEVPPEYDTDPGVKAVGTITHVMNKDHLRHCESRNKNGKILYKLRYIREVLLGSKEGTRQFRVMHNGEELGSASIKYARV